MKTKLKGIVARRFKATKGYWEVVAVHNSKLKKAVRFKAVNETTYEGYYEFMTRLIARNGNELCNNPRQFNSIRAALKNIMAVKASA